MACNSCSYLDYLDKLVDEFNHTFHHSIVKTLIHANYSALSQEIEINLNAPKFKVGCRVRITKHKSIFSKCYTKDWLREISVIVAVIKTNP